MKTDFLPQLFVSVSRLLPWPALQAQTASPAPRPKHILQASEKSMRSAAKNLGVFWLSLCLLQPGFSQTSTMSTASSARLEKEKQWQQLNAEAHTAYTAKRFLEAKTKLQTALRLAQELRSDWRLGFSHDALAYCYQKQGSPAAAKEHYNQAFLHLAKCLNGEDPALMDYLGEVSEFYTTQGWRTQFIEFVLTWIGQEAEKRESENLLLEGLLFGLFVLIEENELPPQLEAKFEATSAKLHPRKAPETETIVPIPDPLWEKARPALTKGDNAGAEQIYRDALATAEQQGAPSMLADRLEALADFLRQVNPGGRETSSVSAMTVPGGVPGGVPAGAQNEVLSPPPPLPPPQRTPLPQVMPPRLQVPQGVAPDNPDVLPKPVPVVASSVVPAAEVEAQRQARRQEQLDLLTRALQLRESAIQWNTNAVGEDLIKVSEVIAKL